MGDAGETRIGLDVPDSEDCPQNGPTAISDPIESETSVTFSSCRIFATRSVPASLENALERFQLPWNLKAALDLCFVAFSRREAFPLRWKML
jgi:hypothetical protein